MFQRYFVDDFWVTDQAGKLSCECRAFSSAELAAKSRSDINAFPTCDHTHKAQLDGLDKRILCDIDPSELLYETVALWVARKYGDVQAVYPVPLARVAFGDTALGDRALWRVGLPKSPHDGDHLDLVGLIDAENGGRRVLNKMLRSELLVRGMSRSCVQCDRIDLAKMLGVKRIPPLEKLITATGRPAQNRLSLVGRRGWWLTYNEVCEDCCDDDLIPKV